MAGAPQDSSWGLRLAAAALAWLAGVAAQLQQPALWPPGGYAAASITGLLALLLACRRRAGVRQASLLACIGLLLLGLAAAGLRAGARLAESLPPALEGQDLVLTGVVAALPRRTVDGTRFAFEVEQAQWRGQRVVMPTLVSLGWYRGWHEDALIEHPADGLRAGQRWRFTARLKQPHGTLNPHGFDFELWLFEQDLRATGYVRATSAQPALRLADAAGYPVQRLRQALRDAIDARVGDPRAAGVLSALAVGDQSAIEREDWDLFRATGIAHLVAISGLHVTMFAWLAGAAIGALWRRSERAALALPTPLAARWGGLLAAAGYALLAGWGVPAQRTVWMLGTAALLASLWVRWPWPLVLLAAAVVVTAVDPWALLQPGFWLSFVAVGLLMASPAPAGGRAPERNGPASWWARLLALARGGLRTQLVATLGLAPLTLLFFQQVSLVGFAANLLAIPLVTLLITPLALLGALLPPLWLLGAGLVQGLSGFLSVLAGLPMAVWTTGAAPLWAQAAGLLAGVLLVLPLPWRVRALALPLAWPLFVPLQAVPPEGRFELLALDVGQGSAVLVRTRRHLLVHDAGPQYSRERDAGERVLAPLLRARGERAVDLLVLSHRDSDHVGGAASLMAALPVHALSTSLEPAHALLARGVPHRPCEAGQRWTWDGVHFELLHPPAADHGRGLKPNALSCVLRVEDAAGASALLTGDLEAAQEAALVARLGPALQSGLLVVPHHGSRTSSSLPFLLAVAPRWAVVQAGYRNRFGHPAAEVMERYEALGIEVLRSDRCGAARWQDDAEPVCERRRVPRYWHHALEASGPAP